MKSKILQATPYVADYAEKHEQVIPNYIYHFNRWAMALVFFWFGFLKVLGYSPAESLVKNLYNTTIGNWPSVDLFVRGFGLFECVICIMWLIPSLTRYAFWLFVFHMITTFMPLFFLPSETWQDNFVLSLTGQYIVKNVVLVGSALAILYCYRVHEKKQ